VPEYVHSEKSGRSPFVPGGWFDTFPWNTPNTKVANEHQNHPPPGRAHHS
jgi:hypothetical protein